MDMVSLRTTLKDKNSFEYKFCLLQSCLKEVPGTKEEQSTKAPWSGARRGPGNLRKNKLLPSRGRSGAWTRRRRERPTSCEWEAAASAQALPRLQAPQGWAEVSGRPRCLPRGPSAGRWSPKDRGAGLGTWTRAKRRKQTPRDAPTVAPQLALRSAPAPGLHPAGSRAWDERPRGSGKTPASGGAGGRQPAHLPGTTTPPAPSLGAAAARPHPRCCQADAHLGARERVCVAAEKWGTGSSGR